MIPIQAKETRQAFFAAFGQAVTLITVDLVELSGESDDEAAQVFESLQQQVLGQF